MGPNRRSLALRSCFCAVLICCVFSANSFALSFDLTFGSGLSGNQQAQDAFTRAADRWAAELGDNVVVKIDLDYQSLGTGILGQAGSTVLQGGFNYMRNMMTANAGETNNAREAALLPNLPTASQFSAYMPTGFALDGYLNMTQANYMALGGSRITGSDGSITFSSNFSWDFDSSDGIDSGKYDFEGVAVHEIGHILGFKSEVDYIDWAVDNSTTLTDVSPYALDMFRFRDTEIAAAGSDFTNTARSLIPGGTQYSFFDDITLEMATGAYTGDGRQASHFKDNLGIGIMDPTFASGQVGILSQNDLIAMDLIGWQLVPEPTSVMLFALAGLLLRKKR